MVSGDFLTFSEWYHYAILILWIVLLFVGIRYMDHFDALFKTKDAVKNNPTHSKSMLITSFVLGLSMVVVWMFKPAEIGEVASMTWNFIQIGFYGLFVILIVVNAFIGVRIYAQKHMLIRTISMSLLMLLYFFTGMYGGLLVIAAAALALLIYVFVKFKNILNIK